jgi:hypothetical protein
MKKYFRLLVEGKREDDWDAYFANLKKTVKPYGKQFVHGETGKIVTPGPTDSQHYDIVLSNLGQFGFQSLQHMADTVNAHNANNQNYKPLTSTSILSEKKGFPPVIGYLQDQGWAHVTHQPSDRRPVTYIRTANHAAAQSAMSLIKDQLLPEVSIETKTHVSELRSRQEIEHYITSTDPSGLIYTSRKPTNDGDIDTETRQPSQTSRIQTIGTRQPTDAERYAADRIIRKTIPKYKMEAESFTFSKLRTQLNEEHDDLIKEISPVMWIHKDSIYGGGHEDGHDHNYLAQMILGDYGKRPEGNYSDQVLGLGGWTRLMKVGKTQFEIESASHKALRDTLRRIEPHLAGQKVRLEVRDPNNADPAHVWSRSNVNAEQLRHYIKHGHQARSLRVESWQEYHTNKKFLVEEKVESFVASGMKRHPLYSEDSVEPNEAQPPRGPRKKQLSEFEDFLRTIHPHVSSKYEKDFVINNHVQLIPEYDRYPPVGHHGTEDIEMLKEMLKHQRVLVKRGISKPEDIGTSTLAKISALHDKHEDILIPIKKATSAQGLAPYKIGRIEHPTKKDEHLDVHLMRNITDDKEADTIAKNVKMACPAGSTICIQHKGQYVQDYSRGHGLLVFTNPKSGDVEFAHGHNDGFRTHKNGRVEKDVYHKIVNNIFKLNSPKMTPYLLEHGSADEVHPLISKMLSQNNVNDLNEDDQRSVVMKGNHSHITQLLKRQKLSGEVQDLIRDKGNDSHRNALSERPDRISLDNPSSHEYIANHRGDDQLEKLLDHPQLDPKLIRTIHNRIESPRVQLKLLKADTVENGARSVVNIENKERYELNIVAKLHEKLRTTGSADIHHTNVIDQLLELPSITPWGQQAMIRRPFPGIETSILTPQQLTKLMSRSDFAQSAHGVVAEHGSDWHRTQLLKRKDFSVNAHVRMAQNGNYEHIAELLKRPDLDINTHKMIATNDWTNQSDGDLEKFQRNLITLANRQDLNPDAHYAIAKYGNDAAITALLTRHSDIHHRALAIPGIAIKRARLNRSNKANNPIEESWQEYDAKVGETNTSLFEPGNTKFDMKAFLKKLRKKNGVRVNLPGEN